MKPKIKKYLIYASVIIVGGGLLFILVQTIRAKNTGFETKTLWDWMELLIIPLVLAIGAYFLNHSENTVERQIAEERVNIEREIARDRQQEDAYQSYIDKMSELLLKEKLLTSKKNEVRDIAITRTFAVLRMLDSRRKGLLLRFLFQAGLINVKNPIVFLAEADLSNAYLRGAYLPRTNLIHVDFRRANLSEAHLEDSKLQGADFRGANLRGADLIDAEVSDDTNLDGADLRGARMPDGTKHK